MSRMADRVEWTSRVAAWRSSGSTARAFCTERGYAVSSLYLWASKLQRAQRPRSSGVKLARVVREGAAAHDAEIVVESGSLRVRLSARAVEDHLEHVLATLARVSQS
jgi:hypothetical protein